MQVINCNFKKEVYIKNRSLRFDKNSYTSRFCIFLKIKNRKNVEST